MNNDFVHLHVHTEMSLLDGVGKVKDYVKKAVDMGQKSLAITEHGNLFSAIEFYKECKKYDVKEEDGTITQTIKPIIGSEIYICSHNLEDKSRTVVVNGVEENNKNFHLILLCKNNKGYQNLLKISSIASREGFYYRPRIDRKTLAKYSEGLICMSACGSGDVAVDIRNGEIEKARRKAEWYKMIFGDDYYIELQSNGWDEQVLLNIELNKLAKELDIKTTLTCDVHYVNKGDDILQTISLCISRSQIMGSPNAPHAHSKGIYLKSFEEVMSECGEYEDAIRNTNIVADKCNVEIEFGKYKFPNYELPTCCKTMEAFLRKLSYLGLKRRFPNGVDKKYLDRMEYELDIINTMGFNDYFIVVWDFTKFQENNGFFLSPGRGSGAGSLVLYCLYITGLDPIKYDLLFERFLNPERISMPDIDVDLEDERRGEVIDYVVDKYGEDKVAHIITFGRMKAKSTIKDIGRVMGIPLEKTNELAKMLDTGVKLHEAMDDIEDFRNAYEKDPEIRKLIDYCFRLENTARHSSVHAAGILITADDIDSTIPLYKDNKTKKVSSQWTMGEIEDVGAIKFDFLGLKNLTIIGRSLKFIKEDLGIDINLYDVDVNDEGVYKKTLQTGDSKGIFQLESDGMRKLLIDMIPDRFDDLVAVLALYRPGPLGSGMVDDYVAVKNGKKEAVYPHPSLEEVLKPTHGVILYQEQIMKIVQIMGNYTLGGADLLRRAIGKKKVEILAQQRNVFVPACVENGYEEDLSNYVFDLIEKFAGYGFNKSHSAAYAIISFWTAYLKTYYPKQYYSSVFNSERSDIDKLSFYIDDARSHGINVVKPNVNKPASLFRVVNNNIVFGMSGCRGIRGDKIEGIVKELKENGEFVSLFDFAKRCKKYKVDKKVMSSLCQSGAFDDFEHTRTQMFESIPTMIESIKKTEVMEKSLIDLEERITKNIDDTGGEFYSSYSSFKERTKLAKFNLTTYKKLYKLGWFDNKDWNDIDEAIISERVDDRSIINLNVLEWSKRELLDREMDSLGFYLSGHPMEEYASVIERYNPIPINMAIKNPGNFTERETFYGIVRNFRETITKKKQKMCFFDLEDKTNKIKVVCFPKKYEKCKKDIKNEAAVKVSGRIECKAWNGQKQTQMILSGVTTLEEIRMMDSNCLEIVIHEKNNKDTLSKIGEVVEKNKGANPLYLTVESEGEWKTTKLKPEYWVKISKKLNNSLLKVVSQSLIRYRSSRR